MEGPIPQVEVSEEVKEAAEVQGVVVPKVGSAVALEKGERR